MITITNGKALYEGLEIENFEIDLLKLYQSGPDQCPEWKEDVGDCGKSTCIFCQVEAFMNNLDLGYKKRIHERPGINVFTLVYNV